MQGGLLSEKTNRVGRLLGSFFAMFAMIFLRYLYFGFAYYPQLDDYIQYHNYAAMGSLAEMISYLGLLRARPLAGVLDIALWSKFWENMGVALLLLSLLYAASALVFYRLFQKMFGTGKLFVLFYTLLPLGMEGSYWISASTRLLPGLLFCALSAYVFYIYLKGRKARFLFLSLVFQISTFCFYEQIAVLSCGLNLLIAVLLRKEAKRCWTAAFSCVGVAAFYFLLCKASGESALYSGRTALMLPTSAYYFREFLPDLLSQIYSVFIVGGIKLLQNGVLRGFQMIVQTKGFWKFTLYLIVCAASFFFFICESKKRDEEKPRHFVQIGCGILLALLPLAPFFILANPYFSLRGALPSLPGIALVFDGFARSVLHKEKILALLAVLCAGLFSVAAVSELSDYRDNYTADVSVVRCIAETEMQGDKIAIFGLRDSFLSTQNFFYHEHINGVTSSSWALTGAVRCEKGNVFEKVTYIPYDITAEYLYKPWNYGEKQISTIDAVFAYDDRQNQLLPLALTADAAGIYGLYDADGNLYGQIVEENQTAKFFRK